MKRKLALLLFLITSLMFAGCSSPKGTHSDMSGYEGFGDREHVFYDATVNDMLTWMKNKKDFVVYFGFDNCPWCIEAIHVLNETAMENDEHVAYINTRLDESWSSNADITDYDRLVDKVGEHLGHDADGNPHLYTPMVMFIKKGKVVLAHEGTVEGHDAHERTMMEFEIEELHNIYQEGFDLIK